MPPAERRAPSAECREPSAEIRAWSPARWSIALPASHRFPMAKYQLVRDGIVSAGLLPAPAIREPDRISRDALGPQGCDQLVERVAAAIRGVPLPLPPATGLPHVFSEGLVWRLEPPAPFKALCEADSFESMRRQRIKSASLRFGNQVGDLLVEDHAERVAAGGSWRGAVKPLEGRESPPQRPRSRHQIPSARPAIVSS